MVRITYQRKDYNCACIYPGNDELLALQTFIREHPGTDIIKISYVEDNKESCQVCMKCFVEHSPVCVRMDRRE